MQSLKKEKNPGKKRKYVIFFLFSFVFSPFAFFHICLIFIFEKVSFDIVADF